MATIDPVRYASTYRVDQNMRPAERLAKFLDDAVKAGLGRRFFDKRLLTKVAYDLRRMPEASNEYVLKFSSLISRTKFLLETKGYNRSVKGDRTEGFRATEDDEDRMDIYETQIRQVRRAHDRATKTAEAINVNKLPQGMKDRMLKSRKILEASAAVLQGLPQLMAKNGTPVKKT